MQTVAVSEIQPAVSLLEKTPVLFETLLGDLPTGLLQWKPAADRWSIATPDKRRLLKKEWYSDDRCQ